MKAQWVCWFVLPGVWPGFSGNSVGKRNFGDDTGHYPSVKGVGRGAGLQKATPPPALPICRMPSPPPRAKGLKERSRVSGGRHATQPPLPDRTLPTYQPTVLEPSASPVHMDTNEAPLSLFTAAHRVSVQSNWRTASPSPPRRGRHPPAKSQHRRPGRACPITC